MISLSLSQGLEGLTRLEELYLVNNKIAVVTDKVSALTNLTLLELGSNRLRQVLVYEAFSSWCTRSSPPSVRGLKLHSRTSLYLNSAQTAYARYWFTILVNNKIAVAKDEPPVLTNLTLLDIASLYLKSSAKYMHPNRAPQFSLHRGVMEL
jgi:Leucine-rich repeat (LRR) protein